MRKTVTMLLVLSMVTSSIMVLETNEVKAQDIDGKQQYLAYIQENMVENEETEEIEISEEELKTQEVYEEVINTLLSTDSAKDSEALVLDEEIYGESAYMPDDYAGTYIDDDGTVVVLLSKKDDDYNDIKTDVMEVDNSIKIEKVKYSFEELARTKDNFDAIIKELSEKSSNGTISAEESYVYNNIVSCAILVENNSVLLTMESVNENSIQLFEKYFFKSLIMEYEEGESVIDSASTTPLQPGRAIYNLSADAKTVYRCSIGYPAIRYNSAGEKVYGFITCAHSKVKNDNIYIDKACSIKIGKVTQWKYSGNVDAAFVDITNSNYGTSRKVYYSNSAGNTTNGVTIEGQGWYYDKDSTIANYNPAKGEKTWKAGSTTYLTTAKIQTTWTTITITQADNSKVTFTDVYATTNQTASGDSGGVFFQKDDCGEYSVMGIVKGNNSTYSYFIRIENIQKAFNLYILGYDLYHGKQVK